MKAGWCRHYTGLVGRINEKAEERRCEAGVLYESVKARRETGGISAPCVPTFDHGLTTCAMFDPITPEEDAEAARGARSATVSTRNRAGTGSTRFRV